jgi:hypothetical protein
MPRIALIADTDSRWKWGIATIRSLGAGVPAASFLVPSPGQPNARQLAEAGVTPSAVEAIGLDQLPDRLMRGGFDAAVLALPGGAAQLVLRGLASLANAQARRPVIVTGYVGVVLHRPVEGLALRIGSDIILVNSPHDAVLFSSVLSALGRDPAAIVETRLPFLAPPVAEDQATAAGEERPYTVTFAAQPGIPATRADRDYIVRRLLTHARINPQRRVILKVRGLPGERLTHPEPYPYPAIARRLGAAGVANFHLQAGPMRRILAITDLLLTVSSTAAVEAIHAGLATGILTDFGLREDYGLPFYLGSGCLLAMDQVDGGAAPQASGTWAQNHGLTGPAPGPGANGRLAALLAADLGPVEPLYDDSFAPAYLRTLAAGMAGRSPSGGIVQRAAQAAYRAGVNVVAPALRSLGA